jgi:hypothetical protein
MSSIDFFFSYRNTTKRREEEAGSQSKGVASTEPEPAMFRTYTVICFARSLGSFVSVYGHNQKQMGEIIRPQSSISTLPLPLPVVMVPCRGHTRANSDDDVLHQNQ